jgi:hypothetical protein
MKIRSIKVLLIILLTELETNGLGDCWGLCGAIYDLWNIEIKYSFEEMRKITTYINDHRPRRGTHYAPNHKDSDFFWDEKTTPPRIAWLKYRISKHEILRRQKPIT